MKIAYFGTPIFSATLLEKLILDKSLGIEIALVVTQPDKPVGRKMIMTPSPVKVVAQKYKIPVFDNLKFEISNLKSSSNDKLSKNLNINNLDLNKNLKFQISNLDLCLVYAYGFKQLIPLDLLKAPKMQLFVNIHPSLLPLYRGSSPIAYPILLGDNKTGVTLFVMDEKMDHGPIIAQEEMEITLTDVRTDMETKLTDLGFEMVKKFLISTNPPIRRDRLRLIQQNHSLATRSPYMTKDDGFIPLPVLQKALKNEPLTITELPQIIRKYILKYKFQTLNPKSQANPNFKIQNSKQFRVYGLGFSVSPKIIYDFWRGMSPWPGLWTLIQPARKRLKIIDMEYHVETHCNASLRIKTVQLEGKSPVAFPPFQKAYQIFK